MSLRNALILCFILFFSLTGTAQDSSKNTALAAAKAWWHALTFGDTAYLNAHATRELTVTFNNGKSFTHAEILAHVATFNPAATIKAEWSQIGVQTPAPAMAIVTSRVVETVGNMSHSYKFITVLVTIEKQWKVAAAQSTREIELAPTFDIAEPGQLKTYEGSYRTPGAAVLKIQVRDTALVLVEPSGAEIKLAAIAPDLFEIPQILSAGNVRFAFSRDTTGRVTHMIRIAHKITTMARVE